MTFEELKELIALVNKSNLTEFKYQEGETKIRIRTGKYSPKGGKQQIVQQAAAPMNMMSAAPVSAPPPQYPRLSKPLNQLPKLRATIWKLNLQSLAHFIGLLDLTNPLL